MDLANTLAPMLPGVAGLLEAMREAHFRKAIDHMETPHATVLLVGQSSLALPPGRTPLPGGHPAPAAIAAPGSSPVTKRGLLPWVVNRDRPPRVA